VDADAWSGGLQGYKRRIRDRSCGNGHDDGKDH